MRTWQEQLLARRCVECGSVREIRELVELRPRVAKDRDNLRAFVQVFCPHCGAVALFDAIKVGALPR